MPLRLSLDQIQIHEPCHESWDSMRAEAGGKRRHCDSCVKSVHDFSTMSRVEVEHLLAASDACPPCVRFSRGADGRILTREDFERLARPKRRGWLQRVAAIAATLGIGSLFNFGCNQRDEPVIVAGGIAPSTMPALPPEELVLGRIAPPTAGIPTVMGDLGPPATQPSTRPATRPSNDPTITSHTVGFIAIAPPASPDETTAATPKRGRRS